MNDIAYISRHAELTARGYDVQKAIPYKDLSRGLANLGIECAEGRYDDILIIPSEISMDGEDWIPDEPVHMVYVKRSENYQKELDDKKAVHIVSVSCKHKDGGDSTFQFF